MQLPLPRTTLSTHRIASPSGSLSARVIRPLALSGQPPIVALHGISRNADELVALFRPEAAQSGRIVIVPHFPIGQWSQFQRPGRTSRPDQALLALLSQLALADAGMAGPVEIFGHSGGAQLAHRFAMLYPQRVAGLHLAAAGWYCLPDTSMAYPYGLDADASRGSRTWVRRHSQGLQDFLSLPVRVFVGSDDTARDDSLRQTPDLDRMQGATRIARAQTYVERFRLAAQVRGIRPDITLNLMPGITHDVAQAIREGGLARLVTSGIRPDIDASL